MFIAMTAPIEVSAGAAEAVPDAVLSRAGGTAPSGAGGKAIEGRSLGQIAWLRLRRDKVAMAGGVVVILLILVAVFGSFSCRTPTLITRT